MFVCDRCEAFELLLHRRACTVRFVYDTTNQLSKSQPLYSLLLRRSLCATIKFDCSHEVEKSFHQSSNLDRRFGTNYTKRSEQDHSLVPSVLLLGHMVRIRSFNNLEST